MKLLMHCLASNITPEWHYVDVSETVWKHNLEKRNSAIVDGNTSAYFVDDNIANKFWSMFEEPSRDEIAVWYKMIGVDEI